MQSSVRLLLSDTPFIRCIRKHMYHTWFNVSLRCYFHIQGLASCGIQKEYTDNLVSKHMIFAAKIYRHMHLTTGVYSIRYCLLSMSTLILVSIYCLRAMHMISHVFTPTLFAITVMLVQTSYSASTLLLLLLPLRDPR